MPKSSLFFGKRLIECAPTSVNGYSFPSIKTLGSGTTILLIDPTPIADSVAATPTAVEVSFNLYSLST